jgi:TRAP transporter TAXI family solute receptor
MRRTGVVACLVGVLVCGCGAAPEGRLPRANMITGGTGSDWYRIGSAISERTNVHFPGQPVTAVPGAGGISNPARVGRLPGDFAISFVSFLRAAREGVPPYREPYPDLRHVATLLQNKLHVIAAPRLGVTSLEEIVERRLGVRIGTGAPGSAEEFLLRESLAILGVSYEDIRAWGGRVDLLGSGERSDLYRDGHIDLIVFHIADPSSTVTELMVSHPAVFLNIGAKVSDALGARWGVQPLTFEPGRYPNLNHQVKTVGLDFGLFTTADMDEHLVYTMVKVIDESLPYLRTVHIGFREWESQRMVRNGGVPTHPGAQRYFSEKGWAAQ